MAEREIRWSGTSANKDWSQFHKSYVSVLNEFFEKLPVGKALKRPTDELGIHHECGGQFIRADVGDPGARVGENDEFQEECEIRRTESVQSTREFTFTKMENGKHMSKRKKLEIVSDTNEKA